MRILIYATLLFLIPSLSRGQLEVAILDYPEYVYTHQPIYVTYEVRNIGALPEVVPIGECSQHGVYLETSADVDGSPYRSIWMLSHCSYRLRTLSPGERYLRHEVLRSGSVGRTLWIRAFARSSGMCEDNPGRAEELGTQPIPPTIPASNWKRHIMAPQKYVCWQGEVYSEPVGIEIRVPDGEQDRAVREWLGDPPEDLHSNLEALVERFPKSQYTYARLLAANLSSPRQMERAMELQPDNPLNRHVLGQWAFIVLSRSGPCEDEHAVKPLPTPIADLPVSEPVRAWLEQENQRIIDICSKKIQERRQQLEKGQERAHDEGHENLH